MTWRAARTMGELLADDQRVDPLALGRLFGRAQAELHRPAADGSVLCHLDFQPFNVLVEGETVTGIIDWGDARLGDPRECLAWTEVVLRLAPAMSPRLAELAPEFLAGWRAGYGDWPSERDRPAFLAVAARRQAQQWAARAASFPAAAALAAEIAGGRGG